MNHLFDLILLMLSEQEKGACIKITSLPELQGVRDTVALCSRLAMSIYSKAAVAMGYDFMANIVLIISLGEK